MKAYIGAVLDRSGSMAAVGRQAVDGLNGFVEEQKQTNPDAGLCIVAFNHRHEIVSAGYISGFRPIAHKEYKANGTTALTQFFTPLTSCLKLLTTCPRRKSRRR